ncbi:MAG: hypothetical protein K6F05_04155 [Succinivibrio sp.]|nr:hypothetical protein [Succinivibrio sp.]
MTELNHISTDSTALKAQMSYENSSQNPALANARTGRTWSKSDILFSVLTLGIYALIHCFSNPKPGPTKVRRMESVNTGNPADIFAQTPVKKQVKAQPSENDRIGELCLKGFSAFEHADTLKKKLPLGELSILTGGSDKVEDCGHKIKLIGVLNPDFSRALQGYVSAFIQQAGEDAAKQIVRSVFKKYDENQPLVEQLAVTAVKLINTPLSEADDAIGAKPEPNRVNKDSSTLDLMEAIHQSLSFMEKYVKAWNHKL